MTIKLCPNCSEYVFRVKFDQNKEKLNKFVEIMEKIENNQSIEGDDVESKLVEEINKKYNINLEYFDSGVWFGRDKVFNIEHYKVEGDCGDHGTWVRDLLDTLGLDYDEKEY